MKTLLSLATVGALFTFTPVAAKSVEQPQTARVGFADLDLGSTRGIAELDRRIAAAVQDYCGTASDINVKGKNDVRRCRAEARRFAAQQREQALAAYANSGRTLASAAAGHR
ncbi:UrcA family protein [Sphingosinicella sp. BN140058]|uniref:UrcA family protein n=1 Tax=Sphingosinicella sp. BN140058 TaxID=1892855 RepID=UPI0013EA488C|nr:UrcA family protein [Sphingosinicella sp. BN140058]